MNLLNRFMKNNKLNADDMKCLRDNMKKVPLKIHFMGLVDPVHTGLTRQVGLDKIPKDGVDILWIGGKIDERNTVVTLPKWGVWELPKVAPVGGLIFPTFKFTQTPKNTKMKPYDVSHAEMGFDPDVQSDLVNAAEKEGGMNFKFKKE